MNHNKFVKRGAILLGALIAMAAFGLGIRWVYPRYKASRPNLENFGVAVRTLWAAGQQSDDDPDFRKLRKDLCVWPSTYPEPDARSRAKLPLAWHLDFRADLPNVERQSQLKQFDALSQAGLLSRTPVFVRVGDVDVPFIRYRLTTRGWAASSYGRSGACLVYGYQHEPVISGFERKQLPGQPRRDWYEVKGTYGAGPVEDIAEWARSDEMRTAFPEIQKQLAGNSLMVWFTWDKNRWVSSQEFSVAGKPSSQGNEPQSPAAIRQQHHEEGGREVAQLEVLRPPTVVEVKNLLNGTYGESQKTRSTLECLDLPAPGGKLPVDKDLSTSSPRHYAVAIFRNKDRPPYDRVAKRTRPYLERLLQIGVMTKSIRADVTGTEANANALFDADVYELAAPYAGSIDREFWHCLPLGTPSVEFVDVQVAAQDSHGMPDSSLRYKLRIHYKSPPPWAKEPMAVAGWAELRGALEEGRACDGRFHFDRRTRTMVAGGGSCWWAFDSYAENE